MGVKDEFHQKAILVCVDELCQRSTSTSSSSAAAAISNSASADLLQLASGANSSAQGNNGSHLHRLAESSFTSLERCDKCHKFLRGLLHQGFICQCTK
jgi:phosphoinositide-3-kinase regulatory subunit